MEKLVSMIKQRVYFFSTPVIIGDAMFITNDMHMDDEAAE